MHHLAARSLLLALLGLLPVAFFVACTGGEDPGAPPTSIDGTGGGVNGTGAAPNGTGGTVLVEDAGTDGDTGNCVLADGTRCVYQVVDAGPTCGDGVVDAAIGEVCDDANTLAGDGCSGTCKFIEPNAVCPPAGGPCTSTVVCGNGIRDTGESCDDSNTASGDGCVANCRAVEAGYYCPTQGALCQLLLSCGDGHITVGEGCDDSNVLAGDGCSANCQVEEGWRCSVVAGCQRIAVCGDGSIAPAEGCDDGNTVAGDGCSAQCRVEASWYDCSVGGALCVDNSGCGNSAVENTGVATGPNEVCDDGNTVGGDGCSTTCTLEAGWQCRMPGRACVPLCGDGSMVAGREQCDDGNALSTDGCSSTCLVEPGWACTGTPSVCTRSVCGNSEVEPGESCDKGADNGLFYGDGQGCSKTCTTEPTCRTGATTHACTTACGDGNVDAGEACDDGNQVPGDGCSTTCTEEAGFTCADQAQPDTQPCSSGTGQCLVLPVIYRDFEGQNVTGGHPDFFFLGKTGIDDSITRCVPNASGVKAAFTPGAACPSSDQSGLCTGLVGATLGATGKPTLANNTCSCVFTDWDRTGLLGACPAAGNGACTPMAGLAGVQDCWVDGEGSHRLRIDTTVKVIESATTFGQWYNDSPGINTSVRGTLELLPVGALYQFSSSNGNTVYEDLHAICLAANRTGSLSSGFFPVDATAGSKLCNIWPYWIPGLTATACCAGTGCPVLSQWDPLASYNNCPTAGTGGPVPSSGGTGGMVNGTMRNFYFTTEARYLFRYTAAASPTLAFYGDDDVWVFVNGQLALDLGAPHERLEGSVLLNQAFGLADGNIYEIVVFHADRHPRESNYQLTLSGFSTVRSVCQPRCGDAQVTAGEECDLGDAVNDDAAYNGCTTECKFGPFCGDGLVNGTEACDDGSNVTVAYGAAGCAPGCVLPPSCGNGQLDPSEECDEGAANAEGYGGCSTSCLLNPYCGDGVQNGTEECDDGVNTGGYGFCGIGCVLGPRCGDSITQTEAGESCDAGPLNGEPGQCTENCGVPGYCGDAIQQVELGEECDFGANTGEYGGCTPDCLLGPYCGDGVVQTEGNEICDFGALNSPLTAAEYGGCLVSCQLGPHCGDGTLQDLNEQCDDGGNEDQDGCNSICLIEIQVPR